MTPGVITLLAELEVPSMGSKKKLRDTFLPSDKLKQICSQFLPCDKFPFLELDNTKNAQDWMFLESLGVGVHHDVPFLLSILKYCVSSDTTVGIYQLYEAIQNKIWDSDKKAQDIALVQ
jgi:hypothetical protein